MTRSFDWAAPGSRRFSLSGNNSKVGKSYQETASLEIRADTDPLLADSELWPGNSQALPLGPTRIHHFKTWHQDGRLSAPQNASCKDPTPPPAPSETDISRSGTESIRPLPSMPLLSGFQARRAFSAPRSISLRGRSCAALRPVAALR